VHVIERRARVRHRIIPVAKVALADTRQMALPLDTAPQPDLAPGDAEVASVVMGKGFARLALAKATWAFALVRSPAVLPLPLPSALASECVATVEAPIAKAANPTGPRIEYGLHTDDIHEYFVTKGVDMNGILLVKRKPDGSWGASVSKALVPYVLSKAAVKAGIMPPAGSSALPKSLERVVPEKYAYWKRTDPNEAAAVRNALVDSNFFDERLVKVVDGDIRLCIEQLFLYEPDDNTVGKGEPRITSFRDVLMTALPTAMTAKRLSTPLVDPTWRDTLKSETDCLVLSAATIEQLDEVVDELAKGEAVAPWVVEFDDTPVARTSMALLGRVFKVATDDAANRLFVASHALEHDTRIEYIDTPLDKAEWSAAYVNDLPDGAFLYVEGGGEKDGEGKTKPRSLRHFPYKDKDGKIDVPHLRNAVARIPQSSIGADKKESLQAHARRMLEDTQKGRANQYTGGGGGHGGGGGKGKPTLQNSPGSKVSAAANAAGARANASGNKTEHMVASSMHQAAAHANAKYPTIAAHHTAQAAHHAAHTKSIKGDVAEVDLEKALADAFASIADDESGDDAVVAEVSKRVVRIGKKTEKGDEHYVLGIVLEPEVVDAQNDIYSADEIRNTAHEFMQKYRTIGLMHKGGINDKVKILESYIAPCDFEADGQPVKAGTWVMAVKVLDEDLWKACKSGELTGFSIGGSAVRKPDAPPA